MTKTYDPIIIDYNDEHDFSASESPDKRKIENNYLYYSQAFDRALAEIYVDPGYELEMVSPIELKYLELLRSRFGERGFSPIPFYDLKSAMYAIGNTLKKPISEFQIIHYLRNLWRAGYTRRFIRGRTKFTKKLGRGEWYGIHYILYVNRESDE